MGKSSTDHHNDGQSDYASDSGYNPPHGTLEELTTWSSSGCKEITEDNSAYRSGYEHAKSQD